MRVRAVLHVGAICGILLLPLVCLCQFVPGQTARTPYLLLLPHAHAPASGPTLSDEQLADLAFATGEAVSVTDDGAVAFGYGAGLPAGATGLDCGPAGTPLEQNPTLDALIPRALPVRSPAAGPPLRWPGLAGAPQYTPAPPERPPRAA